MQRSGPATTSRGADTRRALLALAAVAALAMILPPAASASPAVDEYSLNLPDAKGNVESPEQSPSFNPAAPLPGEVVAGLERNPSGKALAIIATSRELGAPSRPTGASDQSSTVKGAQPSALAAGGGAVGDPAVIGVIVLLVVVGAGMFLVRRKTPA